MLVEDAAHFRLQRFIAFTDNEDPALPQRGSDRRAHVCEEGGVLHLDDAAGKHHVEPPLVHSSSESLLEVAIVGDEMAKKALLVHDGGL